MDPRLAAALAGLESDVVQTGAQRWLPPFYGPHLSYLEQNFANGLVEETSAATLASYLAFELQDWVIEQLWRCGQPTNWPPCPRHPSTHPLRPVDRGGAALWTCPADDIAVAEIGSLQRGAVVARTTSRG